MQSLLLRLRGSAADIDLVIKNSIRVGELKFDWLPSLIKSVTLEGGPDRGHEVFESFDKVVHLDTACFTAAIDSQLKCGRLLTGRLLFDQMLQRGLKPNAVTYTSLIVSSRKMKKYLEAEYYYKAAIRRKIVPDQAFFDNYVHALAAVPAPTKTSSALTEMRRQGLRPTTRTLNAQIGLCARLRRIQDAEGVMEKFEEEEREPDSVTFNSLLLAFANVGHVGKCFDTLKRMREKKLQPDSYSLVCVLMALRKSVRQWGYDAQKNARVAEDVVARYQARGVEINGHVINALSSVLADAGHHAKVKRLLDKAGENGRSVDERLLVAYVRALRRGGGVDEISPWLEANFHRANAFVCNAALGELFIAERFEAASALALLILKSDAFKLFGARDVQKLCLHVRELAAHGEEARAELMAMGRWADEG
jgi:pentatricopeptide repeat protein